MYYYYILAFIFFVVWQLGWKGIFYFKTKRNSEHIRSGNADRIISYERKVLNKLNHRFNVIKNFA